MSQKAPMHPDTAFALGCFGFLSVVAICSMVVSIVHAIYK